MSGLPDWLRENLLERREIWIGGPLDELSGAACATHLIALEGSGDDRVRLRINSSGGTLGAALSVMDTIAALGVPVEALCTGQAEGPALGVLSVCRWRLASPHARLRLWEPASEAQGRESELISLVRQHEAEVERFISLMAGATGQPAERIEVDLAAGRYFELDEALEYHLIDAIRNRPD